jgi:hypothetical protein
MEATQPLGFCVGAAFSKRGNSCRLPSGSKPFFWLGTLEEHNGGKPGRGSKNKVPIVAAVSLDEAGHPIHVKVAKVETYSFAAIADRAQDALARGCEVISDGLACFRAVAEVGCIHQPVIVNGRHPKDLPDFRWINTVISNLKTSFSGTFHALKYKKYADRYLGAFCYRFNRRFNLEEMTGRILIGPRYRREPMRWFSSARWRQVVALDNRDLRPFVHPPSRTRCQATTGTPRCSGPCPIWCVGSCPGLPAPSQAPWTPKRPTASGQ